MRKKRLDLMVDIEALGTGSDAIILSVGIVLFDVFGEPGSFEACWHEPIDLADQGGRRADIDTIMWWLSQGEAGAAMTQLRKDRTPVSITDLMIEFSQLRNGEEASGLVWANAPTYDLVILRHAFSHNLREMRVPWSFRDERCFRTLFQEFGDLVTDPEVVIDGVKHDALYDAKRQAAKVQQIYRALHVKEMA